MAGDLSRAHADRELSRSTAAIIYNDAAQFVETWANTTSWNPSSGALTVTGSGTAYGPSGANRSFAVATGKDVRITAIINYVSGDPGTDFLIVGVSAVTAGGALDFANLRGIGVQTNTGHVGWWNGSSFVDLTSSALATGTYYVTINADSQVIGLEFFSADRVTDYAVTVARGSFAINNVAVYDSDSRGASGSKVGTVTAKAGFATTNPVSGVDAISATAQVGDTGSTSAPATGVSGVRIVLPAGFDPRKPVPVAMVCHGSGGTALSHPFMEPVLTALGYAVIASDGAGTASWGNPAAVAEYAALYRYARARIPLGPLVLVSESMGGMAGLNLMAQHLIPRPAAWLAYFPVTNLAGMYAFNGPDATAINTAYGISNASQIPAASDPQQRSVADFRGVPMMVFHSPADTVVPKARNTDLFIPRFATTSPETTVVVTSGDHGDASNFSAPNQTLAQQFLQRWVQAA